MKISDKSRKLAGRIEPIISTVIAKYVTPDEVGFLTVSAIEVSGDCQVCDVFLSSISGPERYVKPVQRHSKKIAHELVKTLKLRHNLEIRFKEDKSVKHVEKMKKLLE